MRAALVIGCIAFCFLGSSGVHAASLRVAPTNLTLLAPESVATLNLRNEDTRPINVQIRVLRWSQVDGTERLEPTTDVVASPPLTTLGAHGDYLVRVVRMSKAPVVGEESYRLLVDELPDPARRRPGAVNFVLRYSIPVFFASPDTSPPQVSWTLQPNGKAAVLIATNIGGRHLRIADLKINDAGRTLTARTGLVGYVLGGATMSWLLPHSGSSISGHSVALSAEGDAGAIDATVTVQSGR